MNLPKEAYETYCNHSDENHPTWERLSLDDQQVWGAVTAKIKQILKPERTCKTINISVEKTGPDADVSYYGYARCNECGELLVKKKISGKLIEVYSVQGLTFANIERAEYEIKQEMGYGTNNHMDIYSAHYPDGYTLKWMGISTIN